MVHIANMFLLFVAFLGLAASRWTLKETKVVDCGTAKSVFTINALSLEPAQPVPGDNVSLHLDYSVPAGVTIDDGEARYAATYNFIPLTPTVEPLCKNIPCPLSAGSYSNTSYMLWPSGLSGNLVTKITWVDVNVQQLLCIQISTTLPSS
jgi:hypothetical protein